MRRLLVLVHRVSGLTIAGFLVVAGLTGSLLVWREEIDGMINPDWLWAPPPVAGQPRLPPLVLRDAVLARHPDARVDYLPLHERPGAAATFWLTPRDGARLAVDTVFIDPYSGRTLGARQSGASARASITSFHSWTRCIDRWPWERRGPCCSEWSP